MNGRKSGRKDIAAWTAAVISGNPDAKVDVKILERVTEQLISNDCRIIEESLGIIATTSNQETKSSRERLVRERLTHLEVLTPYADKIQAKEIKGIKKKCCSINR